MNSVAALGAGYLLMSDSSGQSLGFSVDMLQYSPFRTYFIPGLILFIANGLLSGFTFILMVVNKKSANKLILIQGLILTFWIFSQIIMLRLLHPMHLVLGAAGILLIYLGSKNISSKSRIN